MNQMTVWTSLTYRMPDQRLDTKERMVVCVHGDEQTIRFYMKKVRLFPNNEDFITHVWAIKVSEALKLVK